MTTFDQKCSNIHELRPCTCARGPYVSSFPAIKRPLHRLQPGPVCDGWFRGAAPTLHFLHRSSERGCRPNFLRGDSALRLLNTSTATFAVCRWWRERLLDHDAPITEPWRLRRAWELIDTASSMSETTHLQVSMILCV